jgi:hypothetical protein
LGKLQVSTEKENFKHKSGFREVQLLLIFAKRDTHIAHENQIFRINHCVTEQEKQKSYFLSCIRA